MQRSPLFPIVYPDGRVCISILHTPGEDPLGYELPAERWSPVQSIEKILLSVVSMLAGQYCKILLMVTWMGQTHYVDRLSGIYNVM